MFQRQARRSLALALGALLTTASVATAQLCLAPIVAGAGQAIGTVDIVEGSFVFEQRGIIRHTILFAIRRGTPWDVVFPWRQFSVCDHTEPRTS